MVAVGEQAVRVIWSVHSSPTSDSSHFYNIRNKLGISGYETIPEVTL